MQTDVPVFITGGRASEVLMSGFVCCRSPRTSRCSNTGGQFKVDARLPKICPESSHMLQHDGVRLASIRYADRSTIRSPPLSLQLTQTTCVGPSSSQLSHRPVSQSIDGSGGWSFHPRFFYLNRAIQAHPLLDLNE
jgi:hypothetical protein